MVAATFPALEDGQVDDLAHVPAIYETVRRLPEALIAHEVPLAERFAAAAAHFEGWGALDSLRATAPGELVDALEEHGELPTEDPWPGASPARLLGTEHQEPAAV